MSDKRQPLRLRPRRPDGHPAQPGRPTSDATRSSRPAAAQAIRIAAAAAHRSRLSAAALSAAAQPSYPAPAARSRTADAGLADDWVQTQNRPPAVDSNCPPRAVAIDDLVAPNENPIMRAAGPLLILLGRLARRGAARLLREPDGAGRRRHQILRKGYPLGRHSRGAGDAPPNTSCAPLPTTSCRTSRPTDRHVWTQYSMLSRFFGERIGGVRFFEELDRAKMDPLGELRGAGTAACLPCARLPGRPSHVADGQATLAADSA